MASAAAAAAGRPDLLVGGSRLVGSLVLFSNSHTTFALRLDFSPENLNPDRTVGCGGAVPRGIVVAGVAGKRKNWSKG